MDMLVHPCIYVYVYIGKIGFWLLKLRSATFSEGRGGKKAAHSRTFETAKGQTYKARLPADCQEPLQGLQ